jgi:hypothetical protein
LKIKEIENDMTPFHKYKSLEAGRPLIVYELNEVPWRVIDWYARRKPASALARLLGLSKTFVTITRDDGELHPWTTWPTFHRGVTNSQHNIRFVNQNLDGASLYPPIWETVCKAGKRVGVFGSLQSYPPIRDNAYAFYIPDTFAPGCETYPDKYAAFQRFNLRQTQQDGAQASAVQFNTSVADDIFKMIQSGLRLNTCLTLAGHIAKERINRLYRSRRSVLQALVSFDIFQNALKADPPDFCTFFTNHVAGMMHRYWKYTFPEDFDTTLTTEEDRFHAGSIEYAMDVADAQISKLMAYVDARNGRLIVASSMGQEAIDRGAYHGEWRITDVSRFLKAIGWNDPAHNLLAMQPDFNFAFDSAQNTENFIKHVSRLTDSTGQSVWKRIQRTGNTVNLGLAPSKQALTSGEAYMSNADGTLTRLEIGALGIDFLKRDPGTGYHQPRGALLLYGAGIEAEDSRAEVDSTAFRPAILGMLGLGADGGRVGSMG